MENEKNKTSEIVENVMDVLEVVVEAAGGIIDVVSALGECIGDICS